MGFHALANIPGFGIFHIIIFAGLVEGVDMPSIKYTGGPQDLPGGFDGAAPFINGEYPFATKIEDTEECDPKLNIKIQNGRTAMLGVTGAMIYSMLDSINHHFFYPITHS